MFGYNTIIAKLDQIITIGNNIMTTLADILNAVKQETTVVASLKQFITNLQAELQTALNNNDPTTMQSILDTVSANTAAITADITANTPAAPPANPPTTTA